MSKSVFHMNEKSLLKKINIAFAYEPNLVKNNQTNSLVFSIYVGNNNRKPKVHYKLLNFF